MTTHDLKVWPRPFAGIAAKKKRADVRSSLDRTFAIGDVLHFRCWDPAHEWYTGQELFARVTWTDDSASG